MTHPDFPALAICINCGRGVCDACAKVSATGLVGCSDGCLAQAVTMRADVAKSIRKSERGYKLLYWFLLLGGGLLFVSGLINATIGGKPSSGIASIILSLTLLIPALWFRRLSQRDV